VFLIYYRGYIFIRLKSIGTEWKVVERLKGLVSTDSGEDWKVTHVTPVYGGWDVVIECSITNIQDLEKIVTYIRIDEEISSWIEETTTLISTKPDFP
jgi:hypothetical protein